MPESDLEPGRRTRRIASRRSAITRSKQALNRVVDASATRAAGQPTTSSRSRQQARSREAEGRAAVQHSKIPEPGTLEENTRKRVGSLPVGECGGGLEPGANN